MQNQEQELANLVPATEVAEILEISVATVARMAQRGDLVAVAKMPGLRGARLFRREDVERAKSVSA